MEPSYALGLTPPFNPVTMRDQNSLSASLVLLAPFGKCQPAGQIILKNPFFSSTPLEVYGSTARNLESYLGRFFAFPVYNTNIGVSFTPDPIFVYVDYRNFIVSCWLFFSKKFRAGKRREDSFRAEWN